MHDDILENVKRYKQDIRGKITDLAEQCAEVYVSSTMGLTDDHPDKQGVKNSYIEEFRNLMFQQL